MSETRELAVFQHFGHNRPPIDEVLTADYAALAADVEAAIAGARKVFRAIKDEADLAAVGKTVLDLRALQKRIDGIRAEEKQPVLDAGRQIDGFFKALAAKLDTPVSTLQQAADDHARAKAAEERAKREAEAKAAWEKAEAERRKAEAGNAKAAGRAEVLEAKAEAAETAATASAAELVRTNVGGVTSSAQTKLDFRVDDYAALQATLGPLGPYLARPDVEKAIRSLMRIQKAATSLPGVTVFETTKATFR